MIDIYKIILFSSLVISLQAKIFSVLPLHNWTAQDILVLRARVPCRGVYLAAWNGSGMKERKSTWSAKANQVLFTKWRRRWDSNPRAVLPTTRFRVFYSEHTLADFEKKCPILRVNALVRKKVLSSPLRLLPTARNARELSERTNRISIKHNSRKSP